ncbi:MAG TPA: homocysteine S-methyltransferase family protein [Polyangiaceae bacterium]|nr:homocysteine S-methyltransferase family protein [Polyangiaceae bacterium]
MLDVHSLLRSSTVLLDGAWGTELQSLGLAPGACPDVWNLAHPERVESVARSYVDAGSQIILSNTFGASRVALTRHGQADNVRAINRAGAEISLRAAAGRAKVFASVGPTGKLFAMGDISEAELRAAFEEQLSALAEGGVEAVVLETFTDLEELSIALSAAKKCGLSAACCMVFDSGAKKDRSAMGVTPEQAVKRLTDGGADIIGANCGRGVEAYIPICERLRAATPLPLWFKANAGLPQLVDGRATYAITPDQFATGALELAAKGANFVGGCCGTSPAFIRAIAQRLPS